MKNKIIVLAGFSAVGKDTVADELIKQGYNFITSHTTRPMRENESEKNPYYFIDNNKFHKMKKNNEFIEYREYNTLVNGNHETWYYAASFAEVPVQ